MNYYRVADLLGSQHAPVDLNRFPHSWMSFRLRADFMESGLQRELISRRLAFVSNALGNSRVDGNKISDIFADLYGKLLDSVPYIPGQRSTAESDADRERMRLIEEYSKMVAEKQAGEEGQRNG